VSSWAHFCVVFIHFFGGCDELSPCTVETSTSVGCTFFEGPLQSSMAALKLAQETATAAQLMHELRTFIDPATADYFLRESLYSGPPVPDPTAELASPNGT